MVPALAIGLNLLSVGAAYGVMVLVFQHGGLQGLLGFTAMEGSPLAAAVPVRAAVRAQMDYHVFILSRIRELGSPASARGGDQDGIRGAARAS